MLTSLNIKKYQSFSATFESQLGWKSWEQVGVEAAPVLRVISERLLEKISRTKWPVREALRSNT